MIPTPETPVTPTPTVPEQVTAEVVLPLVLAMFQAAIVLLIALVVARLVRSATLRALGRTRADASTTLLVGRIAFIAVATVGAMIALGTLGVAWTTVVALAGVLGLAASLAFQDVLKNFVAGLYLLVERPFRIGERIKVRDFIGRVESIDVRTTVLRTDEGNAVMVPNAILFAEIVLNQGMPKTDGPSTGEATVT